MPRLVGSLVEQPARPVSFLGHSVGHDLGPIHLANAASRFSWRLWHVARLKPLIRTSQPYAKKIAHRGVWVEPSLLAEIEYRAKSAEGKLRHPFFKGIREDL